MNKTKIRLYVGEKRWIKLKIHACDNVPFTIDEALFKLSGNEDVVEGECIIKEHTVSALLSPQKKGWHDLVFTLSIADEIIIKRVEVLVSD